MHESDMFQEITDDIHVKQITISEEQEVMTKEMLKLRFLSSK
jgi:hypothetical protein